jgi:HK97 gp10 family phage protein
MIQAVNCQISGMEELQAALDKGIKQATRAALRRAAKDAVQPWVKLIEDLAPRSDRAFLAEHIAVSAKFKDGGARLEMEIGPVIDAFYGLFLEFGTQELDGTGKDGKHFHHAATEARPFMRPAYEEGQEDVLAGFAEAFGIELEQLGKE